MTTPLASTTLQRARLPLLLGLSNVSAPRVDLAAVGRRITSLLPRPAAPPSGQNASSSASQPARLPERNAPHQYLPIVYAKAPKTIYALNALTGTVRWTHATQESLSFAQVPGVGVAVEEKNT